MKAYTCISTDDHMQEAPDTWTSRMSEKKWGDLIPRAEDVPAEGFMPGAGWVVNGKPQFGGVIVNAAMPDRTVGPTGWDEVPTFTYVPTERVKAMDRDGVDAHTLHPGLATGVVNDKSLPEEFRLEVMRAYNDYIVEEYGDPFPGRFILLAAMPYWSPTEAVKEFERIRSRSSQIRGANFGFPQALGYTHIADPAWDALWRELEEADLPVHLHIGSGGSVGMRGTVWEGHTDPMRMLAEISVKSVSAHTDVAATLMFSGIFERFEHLKVVFAETGVGWMPYVLDLADHQWEVQGMATRGMPRRPSDVFRDHCFANFWFEQMNDELRRAPGLDNVMWLSDFPHPTSTWPTSQDYLATSMATATPEERQQILVDNPRRVYNLPEGY
jgi:predicted TIM-barrel fold metal-dependent hydrolase